MSVNHYAEKSVLRLVAFFSAFIFLGACAPKKEVKKDVFFDKWKIMAENSRGYSPSSRKPVETEPAEKQASILKQEEHPVQLKSMLETERLLPTTPVTMKMHDIDVTVLLRALAKAADQNIMINEKVKGKANININRAPWDQVFKGLLRTHGLTYSWEGDILRIMTLDDMEQDIKRESRKKDFKLVAPIMTRVVKINYADAAKLKTNLEKFLTLNAEGKPIGSIMVDDHTRSLIIQAIQADIEAMLSIIDKLDRPTQQILIEAHIVQARRSLVRDLGITWSGAIHSGSGGGGASPSLPSATGTTATSDFLPRLSIGYFTQRLNDYTLNVQLDALEEENKINVLSSPSITTMDNQMAIIESGKQVPYNKKDDAGNTITEFKDAVLRLEVIPHIIDHNSLSLDIKIKKDEVDPKTEDKTEPSLIKKYAESKVVLFNGQTTVIGGLNEKNTSNVNSGVPTLKDIPLLGYLFKAINTQDGLDDLLIFITPHILKERPFEDVLQPKPLDQPPTAIPSEAIPQ